MSITEAKRLFYQFAQAAFKSRKGAHIPLLGRLITLKYHSQYESQGLENSLKDAFGHELLFGGRRELQSDSRCKVAVTATDTNKEARLLSNYNRSVRTETPYCFQRFENPAQELSIWQSARATSAAPGYFQSYFHSMNGHTYQDGALKLNNPVLAADLERQLIWPDCARSPPDILLSIGTGVFPTSHTSEPGPRIGIGITNGVRTFVGLGKDAIDATLDCERTWQEFMQCTVPEGSPNKNRYYRLNLPIAGSKIELDQVEKMPELEKLTRAHYALHTDLIDSVAGRLLASLFYFEPGPRVARQVTGSFC